MKNKIIKGSLVFLVALCTILGNSNDYKVNAVEENNVTIEHYWNGQEVGDGAEPDSIESVSVEAGSQIDIDSYVNTTDEDITFSDAVVTLDVVPYRVYLLQEAIAGGIPVIDNITTTYHWDDHLVDDNFDAYLQGTFSFDDNPSGTLNISTIAPDYYNDSMGLNNLRLDESTSTATLSVGADELSNIIELYYKAFYGRSLPASKVAASRTPVTGGTTDFPYRDGLHGNKYYNQFSSDSIGNIEVKDSHEYTIKLYYSRETKVETYNVTYHGNGEDVKDVPVDTTDYINDSIVTVASTTPTREGYTFTQWSTNADGTGNKYDSSDTFTINANVDLYAQWEEDEQPTIPTTPNPLDPTPQIPTPSTPNDSTPTVLTPVVNDTTKNPSVMVNTADTTDVQVLLLAMMIALGVIVLIRKNSKLQEN